MWRMYCVIKLKRVSIALLIMLQLILTKLNLDSSSSVRIFQSLVVKTLPCLAVSKLAWVHTSPRVKMGYTDQMTHHCCRFQMELLIRSNSSSRQLHHRIEVLACIFLTAIWLPHGQLWALSSKERQPHSPHVNHLRFTYLTQKVIVSLVTRLGPYLSLVKWLVGFEPEPSDSELTRPFSLIFDTDFN